MIVFWMIVGTVLFVTFVVVAFTFSDRIPLPQPKGRLERRAARRSSFAAYGRDPIIKNAIQSKLETAMAEALIVEPPKKYKTIYDEMVAEFGFDPLAPKFNFPLAA